MTIETLELNWWGHVFPLQLDAEIGAHQWWLDEFRSGWEQPVIDRLAALLGPGEVFVDIGSAIGPYTIFASLCVGPAGRVLAFEPDPVALRFLHLNAGPGRYPNVTIYDQAVGDQDGRVALSVGREFGDTLTHLSRPGEVVALEVTGRTLDSLWPELHLDAGPAPVVKIDVEGAEVEVFAGGAACLPRAKAILVELHHRQLRERALHPTRMIQDIADRLHMHLERLGERSAQNDYYCLTPIGTGETS